MRIVSLNCWGGTLHAALVGWLPEAAPDLLCLQEVVRTPDAPAAWLTLRDGDHVLDQRADVMADMARVLPGHDGTFAPAARGALWHGDREVPSLWGLATFVRRDLPVIAQRQVFVHGTYGADGFGAHPRSRTAHAVRVRDHDAGRAVTVAQMHGLRDPAGKMDSPERAAQAERFAGLSRTSRPRGTRSWPAGISTSSREARRCGGSRRSGCGSW